MTSVKQPPFKFLDSYQQSDKKVFFGRKKETQELYNALTGVKVLLVYGPSGSGKTSLIECGLRNLYSDADWFALTVRRGNNLPVSVFHTINRSLNEKIALDSQTKLPLNHSTGFAQAIEKLFTEKYQPIYLLFDQFEELFISGSEDEKKLFFTELNTLIRHKVPCRLLLIMREEFIGHLSEFESLCTGIFQHRFRVEKMGRNHVEEVIFNILTAPSYLQHFQVEEPQKLTEKIISKLPDKRKEIDLAHVQVFLSELWDRAQNPLKADTEKPLLHAGLIRNEDNLESVLRSFLLKQTKELEAVYGIKVPLELLSCMISDRLTKIQISENELSERLLENKVTLKKPISELLHDLESRRIIRSLKIGDETQYEISHDALALVVGQNRTEEMKLREKADEIYKVYTEGDGFLTQDDIDYLRPFKEYLPYPPQVSQLIVKSTKNISRARRNRYLVIGSIIAVALAGMIAWSIYSRIIELKAIIAKGEAVDAQKQAQELLEIALRGRGDQYKNQNIVQTIEVLHKEKNNPIESLIVPKANATVVTGTKNYDFLIWIDVPSFRLEDIKQVEYRWPCKGFVDSIHIGKEPSLGFAFGYRGWGYCPTIMIKVIPNSKYSRDTIDIPFNLKAYLEKTGN